MNGLTRANLPDADRHFVRNLGMIVDGRLHIAPSLQSAISSPCEITGTFSKHEIEDLAAVLNAGALPATLKLVTKEALDLAPENRRAMDEQAVREVAKRLLAAILGGDNATLQAWSCDLDTTGHGWRAVPIGLCQRGPRHDLPALARPGTAHGDRRGVVAGRFRRR